MRSYIYNIDRETLEEMCYSQCNRAGWNYDSLQPLKIDGIQYHKGKVLKYAKDCIKRMEFNNVPLKAHLLFDNIDLSEYEIEYSNEVLEKLFYECCKDVDWNYKELHDFLLHGVQFDKTLVWKYAKKYMIKHESDTMDVKEILFFLGQDMSDNKFFDYYYELISSYFQQEILLGNKIDFSLINGQKQQFFEMAREHFCYDCCKAVQWDYTQLPSYTIGSVKYGKVRVWKYAKDYMLKNEPDCMGYQEILFFLDRDKRVFLNQHQDIVLAIFQEHADLEKQINYSWMNAHFKTLILEFCYDVCERFSWNYEDIIQYCDKYSIHFYSLVDFSILYARSIFESFNDQQQSDYNCYFNTYIDKYTDPSFYVYREHDKYQKFREQSNIGFVMIFNQLLKSNDETEIINLIGSKEQFRYLKGVLVEYVVTYWGYHDGKSKVEILLNEKLDIYQRYLKRHQKEKREQEKQKFYDDQFNISKTVVQNYLESDCKNIQEFCDLYHIDIKDFKMYVDVLKYKDDQLYHMYLAMQDQNQTKRYFMLLSQAKKIVEMIGTGIVEEGIKRNFDLLDYYQFTVMDFDQLIKILDNNLSVSDYRNLKRFISKYKNDKELSSNDFANIYHSKNVIGVQVDSKERVIPGSGREVTLDEKKGIIRYLRFNNIPVTNYTYNIAFRRWSKGMLSIDIQNVNHNGDRTR